MPDASAPSASRHFRHLVESAPDYLFQTDARARLVYANPAAVRDFPGGPGDPIDGLVLPAARLEAETVFLRLLDGRDAESSAELPVVRRDGSVVWVHLRAWAVRGADGEIEGVQALAREVTARREAVADAQRMADRLRLLYAVTAPSGEPFADRLRRALSLTADLLGLPVGVLARVEGERYTVVAAHDAGGGLKAGDEFRLGDTYCVLTLEAGDVLDIDHMAESAYRTRPCYGQFGLEAYIGAPVTVGGEPYGVLCFSSPRPHRFAEADRDLLRLLSLWVSGGLIEEERERALAESERRFRVLSEATFEGIAFSRGGAVLDANEQFARLLGFASARDAVGVRAIDMVAPEWAEKVREMNGENRPGAYEVELVRRDGTRFWGELQGRTFPYDDGDEVRVTTVRDISRRKAAEQNMRFQADMLAQVSDAVVALDLDGRVTYWNEAAARLHGVLAEDALGQPLGDLVRYRVPGSRVPDGRAAVDDRNAARALPGDDGDFVLDHPDGRRVVSATTQGLVDERGTEVGLLAVVRDVTAQREAEGLLRYRATHDGLTGLANRAHFRERMADALAAGRPFAVALVDLDGFKNVNDSLGHEAGDRLLIALAQRMSAVLRDDGDLTSNLLARLGGDEFGVLLDTADDAAVHAVVERLLAAVATPLPLGTQTVQPGASAGYVVADARYARTGDTAGALLRDADTAMYAAKRAGRGVAVAFTPAMHAEANERFRLGEDLRVALTRDELCLRFQPIVHLATGRIGGFEALVRWQHPERGLLAPDRFIPLAEEMGLIEALDTWVLAAACRTLGSWGDDAPGLYLSVNRSPQAVPRGGFAEAVAAILDETGLAPNRLVLEVTERALVEPRVSQTLTDLRARGVRLGVDDFGTGYSSLALLHTLPVDVLKVDRQFVADMERSDRSRAVVHAVIGLAADLGFDVVAEGIETEAQARALHALGCAYGQGFLFARPVEPDEARALLARPLWTPA